MWYVVADNLNTESSLSALEMAIKLRVYKDLPLIHHSDKGFQYHADQYQDVFIKNKILCSMTQNSDSYENAVTERVNSILKQEFIIDKFKLRLELIKIVIKESVEVHNHNVPHFSNHILTPEQIHQQFEIKTKTYKTKNSGNKTVATL